MNCGIIVDVFLSLVNVYVSFSKDHVDVGLFLLVCFS